MNKPQGGPYGVRMVSRFGFIERYGFKTRRQAKTFLRFFLNRFPRWESVCGTVEVVKRYTPKKRHKKKKKRLDKSNASCEA